MSLPPSPPPPPPAVNDAHKPLPVIKPPSVATTSSANAFMVELFIYNGAPFKDHWAYWVGSHNYAHLGVLIQAVGDVKEGFRLEFERSHDLSNTVNRPTKRIPLQWVDNQYFDEKLMLNDGKYKLDNTPVCIFEASVFKVRAPEKTLNTVDDKVVAAKSVGKKITQRNCQSWIVESADQLVKDHIFSAEVAAYLHAIEQ
ncbi:hypothetical protein PHISCL_00531 [Aspergillus sclerotialis]|uniref:Uncharacterized protein n=1 Tax=Aspergillus sclerotialis TaxID=2070753 RepID=A0A3A2ZVL1_9EURO|nr:hypothetical protein PHISCL_00531 [Aspergillus sclerotialis]